MQAQEIRNKFTEFFIKNGHAKVPSSSLIPNNDPTLLFANAGMNQFKSYFTGKETPAYKRVTSIQKCVRAGGKHNDLENVGMTARHHTFFEMLGNFSFGDYFKKEAINFAWKFLTEELEIPAEKLCVTVHHTDDEAFEIWEKEMGISPDKIFRKGDKDNFWEMGEFGPCGPCSEIFFDHGEEHSTPNFTPGPNQDILDDEMRYVEIWNLVFMQFEKTPEGKFNLPKPCVDTGAGLERLAAVCQGVYWNYDTDAFTSIIKQIEKCSGKNYSDPKYTSNMRVVADHIRSCTMLVTDGVIPSNEGRGYVLRRIIRRAVKHMRDLGAPANSFYKLIPIVMEALGSEYQENKQNISLAEKFLELEERKFLETLDMGLKFLDVAIRNDVEKGILKGSVAFKLYDTYGFPLDLTEIILSEKGLTVDVDGFNSSMEEQKANSRKSWKGSTGVSDKVFYDLKEKGGSTIFVGYDQLHIDGATLLGIVEMGELFGLQFDKTPFYGESGGQAGDNGSIILDGEELVYVTDTKKPIDDLHIHIVKDASLLEIGKKYTLSINYSSRESTASNHSATHLLQSALVSVLGDHVKQSGSSVAPDRLRFDFTHTQAMTKTEIKRVESLVNQMIQQSITVENSVMSKDDAIKNGAVALFGEKYGDSVRVVKMGDLSTELCGGTHVFNTHNIKHISIISESSLSTGIRRIDAVTGDVAIKRLSARSEVLESIEAKLTVKDAKTVERLDAIYSELKDRSREIKELKEKIQANQSKEIFSSPEQLAGGINYIATQVAEGSDLRKMSDIFINKYPNGIVLLYGEKKDKVSALLRSGKEVKGINCSTLLKSGLDLLGGKGGGRPDMAQGSGDSGDLEKFAATIKEGLIESLG
jgi:alanyl-tRNA synthetase